VRNPNDPCKYPHQFFQYFSSSSSPETGSSSKSIDVHDFDNSLPCELRYKKEEPKVKDSFDSVDPSPLKDSSSPSSTKKVNKPLPPFPYGLKKKTKLMLRR